MEKVAHRKKVLEELAKMSPEEHHEKSRRIISNLMNDPAFIAADIIGLTISSFPEVDTKELIRSIWASGKKAAVPKCLPKSRGMDFYIIEDWNQLEVVYMHLQEPKTDEAQFVPPHGIGLMVVPGVVFSKDGYRIGFGGGYYDRYLAGYTGETRSLAFDVQLAEAIAEEPHDVPVGGIYTESGFIDTKGADR
ncbi:5-formyltetrahydrofolate cyclo-ligase [Planococcus chinensis]|uniref:5-formyltetrahydrofolate cyclo-ligase n=1 Tax=Planococcus chinensis TaxID=272917 RepID=A0ABW4QL28_9BACL